MARVPLRFLPPRDCCPIGRRPDAEELDRKLRLAGTPGAPDGLTVDGISKAHRASRNLLTAHRRDCLGLPPLKAGRIARRLPSPEQTRATEARASVAAHRVETKAAAPPADAAERRSRELIETCATILALGTWKGITTVRALAERHGAPEDEVERCYRVAASRVRSGRGGARAQLELAIAVLSQIRDREREAHDKASRLADEIARPFLAQVPQGQQARTISMSDIERFQGLRAVAGQAAANVVAAQKQIDADTLHRKAAATIRVSYSAVPEMGRLVAFLAELVGRIGEIHGIPDLRLRVDEAVAAFEEQGEEGLEEYLAEARADREAILAEGRAA